MTVKTLYEKLSERIPEDLREPWDNDGLMCCADLSAEVEKALVALDVTEEIVDYAIENHFDLILSHHPLIFHPLSAVTEQTPTARKVVKLVSNNISVFSFHTRADKMPGGVNDCLCEHLGITDAVPFGEGGLGRIGTVEECSLEDFAYKAKVALDADAIRFVDAYNPVCRVAVVGGEGKDYVEAALAEGADTFLAGRVGYHMLEEGNERGINILEAGHFFTEQPVTQIFADLLLRLDPDMYVEIADSNLIRLI